MLRALVAILAVLGPGLGASAAASTRPVPPPLPPPPYAARLQRLADALVRPFAPVTPEAGISLRCRQHSHMYLTSLSQLAAWAMHMYDSSTKIPSSLLAGNVEQLGNFDQCVSVRVADADTGSDVFRGKHCTASVSFRMPPSDGWGPSPLGELLLAGTTASRNAEGNVSAEYKWSFCVPSSCSAKDVEVGLRARLAPAWPLQQPAVTVDERRCLAADGGLQSQPLQPKDIAFICLVLVTVYVIVASTVYDVMWIAKGSPSTRVQELLVAFSLRRNGAALLSTARSGDTMDCLHGLRVLSMSWVVLFHTFYTNIVAPNINKAVTAKLGDSWSNMVLLNATLSTDTFLLLSGTLLAVSFLRSARALPGAASARLPFSPLSFYWHRYARLTPVYAVCVWFYASMLPRLGNGPTWDVGVGKESDNCVANWWTNLAYVNNFMQLNGPCMSHTWYLATDMQLFWMSPVVLVPLVRWPRFGRVLLAALVVTSMAVAFTVTFTERLTGAMLYTLDQIMLGRVFVVVYLRVYNRAGPYLVGIALGWVLTAVRGRPLRLPAAVVAAGWTTAAVTCLAVVFGVFGFYQRDHAYSAVEAGLYAGLHRTAWAAGVAWVVFACITGHGGPVNALLSWQLFGPLARLAYCAYLTHFVVIMYTYSSRRTPGYFSMYVTINDGLGILVVTFAVSAVLSLAFEMPFLTLDRVLMPRAGPAPKKAPSMPEAALTTASIATVEEHLEHLAADLRGYDNAAFEKLSEK